MRTHGKGPSEAVWDAIVEALWDGVPLGPMCRTPGFPCAETVRRWRARDPEFNRAFEFAQLEGWYTLADRTLAEAERAIEEHGANHAKRVFAKRRHQLARQAPSFFAGP